MSMVNLCPYCGNRDVKYGISTIATSSPKSVFILSISSKCEGVASGVVAYTTRKDWAEKWVAFNPDHRSYEEVACADSEMEEAIDGN